MYTYIQICGCEYLYIPPEIINPPHAFFKNTDPQT